MEKKFSFGLDIGSDKHYLAILTPEQKLYKEIAVPHNYQGFKMALEEIKAAQNEFKVEPIGGLEGCHGYGSPFDMYLIDHGIQLKQVNSFKLSRYREIFGQPFKKDPHDARLIASFVANYQLLEIDERKCLHDIVREDTRALKLRILSRYQETLVREQTRYKNRIKKHIKEYFPEYLDIVGKSSICNYNSLSFLIECPQLYQLKALNVKKIAEFRASGSKAKVGISLATKIKRTVATIDYFPPTMEIICEVIRYEARRLLELKKEIQELDRKLEEIGKDFKSFRIIKSYRGAGTRTASRLAGEIIDIKRFHSPDALAIYLGVAGNDDFSGKSEVVRTARKVNYRAKNAIMEIAFSSIRFNSKSKVYYAKKRAEGKSHWEAVKCLARHLVRIFYAMLMNNMCYDPNYKRPGPVRKEEKIRARRQPCNKRSEDLIKEKEPYLAVVNLCHRTGVGSRKL